MPTITITDPRYSRTVPVGINGRITEVPVNEPTDVSDDVSQQLANSEIEFTTSKGKPPAAPVSSNPKELVDAPTETDQLVTPADAKNKETVKVTKADGKPGAAKTQKAGKAKP